MRELWKDYPQVVDNTQVIADACTLGEEDVYGKADYIFPPFGDNDVEEFENKCWLGLGQLDLKDDNYVERLKYEIETIKDMGFASYFLVVSDYVRWAKAHNIAVGPGRGSAAGSLAAFSLGITSVDPLEYGLLFQRFLNKGRKSMPDIDVDFCMHRRGEVISYLAERYGQDKVAQITTFSEFKPRGACRDFARVQGEPYALGEKASKLVPPASRGREPTWEKTISASPGLLGPEFNDIVRMARKSEGLNKGRGIHAGGVVISSQPMEEVAPRCLGVGKNKEVASQWDMDDLERVGLVKMDILGLTSLTLLDKTLSLVNAQSSSDLSLSQIPRDCQKTFDLIARGDTSGLFQLDTGGGIKTLCMALEPQSISEIAAISALYRPGPLDSGVVTEYISRVTGKKPVEYLVPELEPVLKMTQGLLIYQEQAMRIATDLAGYDLEGADDLRKAIGKKLPEKMAKEEEKLISGMTSRGIAPDKAREIWEMIKVFADYGFNKSHAVAYSFITYQTAYLKAHYPVEFYCALLTLHSDQRDKLMEYLGDCRNSDIQVLPPDVNESNVGFAIHNGVIRFGLSAVRDVGEKVSKQIVLAREDGQFKDVFDFYERVRTRGVNKRTIEALAKAGALTSLGAPRAGILEILGDLVGYQKEVEKYEKKLATFNKRAIRYNEREQERLEAVRSGEKVKPSLKEPQAPKLPPPVTMPDVEELEIDELMRFEKEMLGLYITSHPLYSYEADILRLTNAHTASLGDHSNGEFVTMLGVISGIKHITTRAGRKMAVIDLEDLHGHLEVTVFSRLYAEVQDILEEENVILLAGKVEASNENVRKLIATNIRLLPKKVTKKKIKEPKAVRIYIDEAGEVTEDMLEKLKEIIDICPGNITTSVDLQLGGFKYRLDQTATVSSEGLKQLKKQPGILVEPTAMKRRETR
jgi:DNA polymerase-3 subunit alpha